MFDDLRQDATSIYEDEQPKAESAAPSVAPKARQRSKKILGMTGPQRFVLSFLFLSMVCVMGFMFLLVMGKIGF